MEQVTYGDDTSDVRHGRLHDDLQEAHDVGSVSIRSLLVVGAEMPSVASAHIVSMQPYRHYHQRVVLVCYIALHG